MFSLLALGVLVLYDDPFVILFPFFFLGLHFFFYTSIKVINT